MHESAIQKIDPQATDDQTAAPPSVDTVTIQLAVTGMGSFKAGAFDTSKGDTEGQVEEGKRIRLRAEAAPFYWFSHWELNDLWADDDPRTKITPKEGMVIRAVFKPLEGDARREEGTTREVIDGWDLRGPGDSNKSKATRTANKAKIANARNSDFDVYFYRNGSQLGLLGPGRSHTMPCDPNDAFEVRSANDADPGEEARGVFVYYP